MRLKRRSKKIGHRVRQGTASLALLSMSILVSLVLGELVLRWVGYYPNLPLPPYLFDNHPTTWWTLRPGFHATVDTFEKVVTYEINEQGIRAPYEIAGDLSKPYVFIGGDSFTFGWLVDEPMTYPRILADRLAAENRPVEVVNLGIPGFGTLHTYERLVEYSERIATPSIVVYMFCPNDPVDNIAGRKEVVDGIRIDEHRKYKPVLAKLGHAYFTSRLLALLLDSWYTHVGNPRFQERERFRNSTVDVELRNDFVSTKRYLEKMIRWTRENEIRFLVMTTSISEYSRPLQVLLDAHDVPMLEVGDIFDEAGLTTAEITNDLGGHWNPTGHEVVAEAIEAFLLGQDWIPAGPPAP